MPEERIIRIEERVEIILDRLAEHIQECHTHWQKQDRTHDRLTTLDAVLKDFEWKEVSHLHHRMSVLEKHHESVWKIIGPVFSTLLGGTIVWVATRLIS